MRYWLVGMLALFVATSTAHAADDFRLSTLGYGPARFGMTLDEAAQALGIELMVDGEVDEPLCYYARPVQAIEGLVVMVSEGRIVRFDVRAPGVKTRSGLGIGTTEAQVIETLGADAVEVTPHKYTGPEGHYLTVWTDDRQAAVRFETDGTRVTSFYAGQVPQVTYVEGCS